MRRRSRAAGGRPVSRPETWPGSSRPSPRRIRRCARQRLGPPAADRSGSVGQPSTPAPLPSPSGRAATRPRAVDRTAPRRRPAPSAEEAGTTGAAIAGAAVGLAVVVRPSRSPAPRRRTWGTRDGWQLVRAERETRRPVEVTPRRARRRRRAPGCGRAPGVGAGGPPSRGATAGRRRACRRDRRHLGLRGRRRRRGEHAARLGAAAAARRRARPSGSEGARRPDRRRPSTWPTSARPARAAATEVLPRRDEPRRPSPRRPSTSGRGRSGVGRPRGAATAGARAAASGTGLAGAARAARGRAGPAPPDAGRRTPSSRPGSCGEPGRPAVSWPSCGPSSWAPRPSATASGSRILAR